MTPIDSLAEAVGNTPQVRLRRFEAGLPGIELFAKLEWFNPGGSVKDRAGRAILKDLLDRGELKPHGPRALLDATSGNTGVAYAWLGAALGVPIALCVPGNVSPARRDLLARFGATVVYSDPMEQSDGAIRLAHTLAREHPDRYAHADQYASLQNPGAHAETTAQEIWRDTFGRVTHVVAGLGTTGTAVGVARGLHQKDARIEVVAVEPDEPLHALEGLKHLPSSLVPPIFDPSVLARRLTITTDEGWDTASRLRDEEGLFAGHSAGAAVAGALVIARALVAQGRGGCIVAVLPDRADRYLPPVPGSARG